MASTSDIRNGMCLELNGDPYTVMEFLHVKPGKGAAFVRTKLRNLNNGRVLENTFPAGAKLTEVRIETREYQYLYNDGERFHFMNNDDYNQIEIQDTLIDAPAFLKEGMNCKVIFHADEERPLSVELPSTYSYEITYTEPGIKGNTATNAMKPATIDTGAEVRVPLFIENGEKIVVNILEGTYRERSKE
jgi:elongation factor P